MAKRRSPATRCALPLPWSMPALKAMRRTNGFPWIFRWNTTGKACRWNVSGKPGSRASAMCSSRTVPTPACRNPGWKSWRTSSRCSALILPSRPSVSSSSMKPRCWTACWKTSPPPRKTPSGANCGTAYATSRKSDRFPCPKGWRRNCAPISYRGFPTSTFLMSTASAAFWLTKWVSAKPSRRWPSSSTWSTTGPRGPT